MRRSYQCQQCRSHQEVVYPAWAGGDGWCRACKLSERQGRQRLEVALSGHFIVLHQGHLDYLTAAAQLGELTVIVNNDQQVKLKYGHDDLLPEQTRVQIMASLKMVKRVVLSIDRDRSVSRTVALINPDLLLNGLYPTSHDFRELEICEALEIPCVFGVGGFEKKDHASNMFCRLGKVFLSSPSSSPSSPSSGPPS
jgi:cytidyltransferase-like protein